MKDLTDKTDSRKALITKLFAYLAKDKLYSNRELNLLGKTYNIANGRPLLGWLDATWAMLYKNLDIETKLTSSTINTDNTTHRHHLYITLKDNLV